MTDRRTADTGRHREAGDDEISEAGAKETALNLDPLTPVRRVTVVIPLHNEERSIKAVILTVIAALRGQHYVPTILLVDDGSTDGSLPVIRNFAEDHPELSYISFSRNFGKEAALMAGLIECGDDFDAVAYMDADGQHTAADLLKLLAAAQDPGVDLVCGVRRSRDYQTRSQQRMAQMFYGLFRRLSDAPIDEGVGDFNVMKPKVVRVLRGLREEQPFMKGLVGWIGFRKMLVPVDIAPRGEGTSRASTWKMLRLALGAILSFSAWPLRAWSVIGAVSALLAALYLVVVVIQTLVTGRDVPGYATTVVLLLGLGGLQMMSIGILGEYVARIYDASKHRPRYIIATRSGE